MHINRNIFLWRGTAYQRLALQELRRMPRSQFRVTAYFGNDFADIFEVRGMRRAQSGVVNRRVAGPDKVVMTYLGLDGKVRNSTVMFDPAPTELNTNSASYSISLAPEEERAVFLTVGCDQGPTTRPARFLRGFLSRPPRAATACPRARRRSKRPTSCSTKCSAGRWRTCRCC